MMPLIRCMAAAMVMLAVAACNKSETPPPGRSPATAANPATPGGGDARAGTPVAPISAEGTRIDAPPTAGIRGWKAIPQFQPTNLNLVLLSPSITIDSARRAFATPISITLPIDPARLPPDVKPADLHPALALGNALEVLEVPVTPSADGRSVTFQLTRIEPMVCLDGTTTPDATASVTVVASASALVDVESSPAGKNPPDILLRAPHALRGDATVLAGAIKAGVATARARLTALNFQMHPSLIVDYVPLADHVSMAAIGNRHIEINSNYWKTTNISQCMASLGHEMFHLYQMHNLITNLQATGNTVDVLNYIPPGNGRWMDEGTARFVDVRLDPSRLASHVLPDISARYGYQQLAQYDAAKGDIHEYQTFIFFEFLAHHYAEPFDIIRKAYSIRMTNTFKQFPDEGDDKQYEGGTFDVIQVLNHVLLNTPDKAGRKRGIREVYAEFLIHYYWLKDFGPLATHRVDALGGRGEIRMPTLKSTTAPADFRWASTLPSSNEIDPEFVEKWSIPETVNGARVNKKTAHHTTPGFKIMKGYYISSLTSPQTQEKGPLKITLTTNAVYLNSQVLLIVFPIKDNKAQAPLIGNPANPVILPQWETLDAALVWPVDMSYRGISNATLTAEFQKQDRTLALFDVEGRSIAPGGTIAVDDQLRLHAFWPAAGTQYLANRNARSADRELKFLGSNKLPLPVRATPAGEGPQYLSTRSVYVTEWIRRIVKPQEIVVEALDEAGNVVTSQKFTVTRASGPIAPRSPAYQRSLDSVRQQPNPNMERLAIATQELADALLNEDELDKAWTTIEVAEKTYADQMKGYVLQRTLLTRHMIAMRRGDLANAIAAMERTIAAPDSAKTLRAECYQRICAAHMTLAHDYAMGRAAWEKSNTELGTPNEDWPFYPKLFTR